ncbi:hypothetical protein A2U01_0047963, partial [Trifolium medium]|nr:hypothetical protein [Trifolium medium]
YLFHLEPPLQRLSVNKTASNLTVEVYQFSYG